MYIPEVLQHNTWSYRISGRVGSMVLVVQITSEAEPAALGRGYPQVGAAGVKDYQKVLRRASQADFTIILHFIMSTILPSSFARQAPNTGETRTCASRKFKIGMSSPPFADCRSRSCSARLCGEGSWSSDKGRLSRDTFTS